MSNFFFQRYVDGRRMADDVLITKQQTLEAAIPEALRLCRNSPKSVLVYVPEDSALHKENARLREVLKPFVPETQWIDPAIPDTRPIDVMVLAGELRAARDAIAKASGETGENT
jgi:hypothetical protein